MSKQQWKGGANASLSMKNFSFSSLSARLDL